MWKRELRPIRREESDEIRALLMSLSGRERRFLAAVTTAGIAAALTVLLLHLSVFRDSLGPGASLAVGGSSALIGAFSGFVLAGRPDGETLEHCDRLRDDLRRGVVEDIRATARDAVRIGIAGEGWDGYLLDVGEGTLMFVESRRWDAEREVPFERFEEVFPCSEVHLVRAPASGMDLGFTCRGPRFDPSRKIDLVAAAMEDLLLKDGDVFAGRPCSAESDLLRLASGRWEGSDAGGEAMVARAVEDMVGKESLR